MKAIECGNLEFMEEGLSRDTCFGVVSILMVFKTKRLNEITKGVNVTREQRKPGSLPQLQAQGNGKGLSKETEEQQVAQERNVGPEDVLEPSEERRREWCKAQFLWIVNGDNLNGVALTTLGPKEMETVSI